MGETEVVRRAWNSLGHSDPMWAILTRPQDWRRWDSDEFFRTGEAEIVAELAYIESLGVQLRHGRVLDFGCGLGRLTQPLADRFDEAVGIDVAPSIIERARAANQRGSRCQFVLNERDDLAVFADGVFDCIFSLLVLQHMAPASADGYLREFIRVLKPGGVGYFRTTEYSRNLVKRLLMEHAPVDALFWLLRHRSRPPFEMHGRTLDEVVAVLSGAGAEVVGVQTRSFGRKLWLDHRIVMRKRS